MNRILLITALAGAVTLAAASGAVAGARTSETFEFSDPLEGGFDCGSFTATISGHDKGHVRTWFDGEGNPIMQVGHIQATEIDTNDSTGATI